LLLVSAGLPEPATARAELVAEAGRRGLNVVTVSGGGGAAGEVAAAVASWRADGLAVCGTPELQAAAAAAAAGHDLPLAFISSAPGDRLAHDIGEWLASTPLSPGRDPCMDLAEVNGIAFVNQVTIGAPVSARVEPERAGSSGTVRVRARSPVRAAPAHAVVVLNNADSLDERGTLAERRRLDGGTLLLAERTRAGAAADAAWRQRRASVLELTADAPVVADVDGVHRTLSAPMRFRLLPGAVRIRTLALDAGSERSPP
jgi:hypothetical protein